MVSKKYLNFLILRNVNNILEGLKPLYIFFSPFNANSVVNFSVEKYLNYI